MPISSTNRRSFLKLSSLGLTLPLLPTVPNASMTIQEAIDRIIEQIPGGKLPQTVDTVKSSDPQQPLKGIVTTFLAAVDVIRQAVEVGANLIITHEPTYYNHLDETDWLGKDPVYTYKRKLLEDNGIVVWRFHDYWHRHQPDGILHGFLKRVDWLQYQSREHPRICEVPTQSLKRMAKFFKKELKLGRTFIVGDPQLSCSRVGLVLGASGRQAHYEALLTDIDVLVVGEAAEWETPEYVRDAAAMGMNKGLIVLGHAMSEEDGMAYLVEWLADVLPGVKATHLPSGDVFQAV